MQPDVVDLWYFKHWIVIDESSLSLKYQRETPSGCKDIGIRKFECVAKTQFFWIFKPEWKIKQSIQDFFAVIVVYVNTMKTTFYSNLDFYI